MHFFILKFPIPIQNPLSPEQCLVFVTTTQAQLIIKANDQRTDGPITTCAYAWQYSVNTRLESILYINGKRNILNHIGMIIWVRFVFQMFWLMASRNFELSSMTSCTFCEGLKYHACFNNRMIQSC